MDALLLVWQLINFVSQKYFSGCFAFIVNGGMLGTFAIGLFKFVNRFAQ
ncbi:MAG: hypothetical protein RLZZ28_572 [Bacteroidota bacterium]|jgi:hypothetical protein